MNPHDKIATNDEWIQISESVRLVASSEGNLRGMPILFGNSLAADRHMWDAVVEQLPAYRSVRFDARGHGQSSAPDGAYSVEVLARDALAVLDHYKIERVVFCGLSLGGLVGMWLAAHAPERIAGLIVANTAATFPPPSMWRDRAGLARVNGLSDLVQPTLERWFTPDFLASSPATVERIAEMIRGTPQHGYAGSCEALAAADLTAELRMIQCPALVICGRQDPSTTIARSNEIIGLVPHARLSTLEAAHLSAVETPDAFTAEIDAFANTIMT
jgi:3-oxoadipate enol-lactonase